jgi:hypothetical protein
MALPKRYFTATVIAIAGCEAVNFRAWRNRNGLFPSTKESGGWNKFSEADIAAVRVVVVLTGLGVEARKAVQVAMACLPTFERLYAALFKGALGRKSIRRNFCDVAVVRQLSGKGSPTGSGPGVVFTSSSKVEKEILAGLNARSAVIMVSLIDIMVHVANEFRTGDYVHDTEADEMSVSTVRKLAKAFILPMTRPRARRRTKS